MVMYFIVLVCIIMKGMGTVIKCICIIFLLMFVQCAACIQCNMGTIHVAFYEYDTV